MNRSTEKLPQRAKVILVWDIFESAWLSAAWSDKHKWWLFQSGVGIPDDFWYIESLSPPDVIQNSKRIIAALDTDGMFISAIEKVGI